MDSSKPISNNPSGPARRFRRLVESQPEAQAAPPADAGQLAAPPELSESEYAALLRLREGRQIFLKPTGFVLSDLTRIDWVTGNHLLLKGCIAGFPFFGQRMYWLTRVGIQALRAEEQRRRKAHTLLEQQSRQRK